MGQHPRPNLPEVGFHLATRLQGSAHLFTPRVRDGCVGLLRRQVERSDARLLAYVIMSNHLHLVVVQGAQALKYFMQPFLRSVAWLVQKTHGVEGHVFERRFRHRVCWDGRYLRNAIGYVHANPVQAGLCAEPGEYRWSSHRLYESTSRSGRRVPRVDVETGLRLFTPPGEHSRIIGQAAYAAYLSGLLPQQPRSAAGPSDDPTASLTELDPSAPGQGRRGLFPEDPPGPDTRIPLDDLAGEILGRDAAGNPKNLDMMRSRRGPRSRLPLRARIARAAAAAGYAGGEIAAYLDVSNATVSRMLAGK